MEATDIGAILIVNDFCQYLSLSRRIMNWNMFARRRSWRNRRKNLAFTWKG
jgi:hypothetical protein